MTVRTTKRQQQALATKQALFDSAIALFKEKGYDAVTVEDIARRAGTAKGSFYTYFRTKSDIVLEEFRTIDQFYETWARNLRRYSGTRDKLVALTRAQMRYVRDTVGLSTLKVLYAANLVEPSTEKILIDRSRYLHTLVCGILRDGQAAGEVSQELDAERLALFYNRACRSVFLDWAISNEAFDLVREGVEFCETVVLPGLLPGTPRTTAVRRRNS